MRGVRTYSPVRPSALGSAPSVVPPLVDEPSHAPNDARSSIVEAIRSTHQSSPSPAILADGTRSLKMYSIRL
jgi:hypothetical protein